MRKTRRSRRRQRKPARIRTLPLVLVACLLAVAVYAFTATINVGGTFQAGSGAATVPTPSITSMYFQYDTNTPVYMNAVVVNFSSSVTTVWAQLAGSWSNQCSGSGTGPWTCTWSSEVSLSTISGNRSVEVVAT